MKLGQVSIDVRLRGAMYFCCSHSEYVYIPLTTSVPLYGRAHMLVEDGEIEM